MTTPKTKDQLIAGLQTSFERVLAYYEGPRAASPVKVDQWDARDTLAHFIFWHDSSTWAIVSATIGGPIWRNPGNADETNAAAVLSHEEESIPELLQQLRWSQARFVRATRNAPDLEAIIAQRPTGESVTVRARLELLTNHWSSHLQALEAASG
ncbi:MAG: hypothetical protein AAB289_04535 [Chloroflexota bacterium]